MARLPKGRPNVDEYRRIVRNLNAVGIQKLRTYCEQKKHPVRNFDRDIEIIRHTIKYGSTSCVTAFGISAQCADQKMRRYNKYALEILGGADGLES